MNSNDLDKCMQWRSSIKLTPNGNLASFFSVGSFIYFILLLHAATISFMSLYLILWKLQFLTLETLVFVLHIIHVNLQR